jgi:endonuclease/exonuclease/phosphatase family metal-dependent hydrolase
VELKMQILISFRLLLLTRLLLALCLAAMGFLLPLNATAANNIVPEVPVCDLPVVDNVITSPQLSVLTLNLAHGRKDALNQMLQKSSTTRRNLEEIADFLSNSGADLIALQEADSPSRWSGKFNHVEFVSQKSPYPCRLHAHHALKYMYDFGTALLSKVPYTHSILHTFAPSPPTTNKGFVMGEVLWNPGGHLPEPITVSVISVHLDFSRKKVRDAQIEEMRAMLPDISPPVIILGDFNTDWSTDESALKAIVAKGNLKVYQPEATELGTYKKGKHRLDWILISKELEFVSYDVPQIVLSDHQPVQASVRLVEKLPQALDSSDHD